VLAVVLYHAGVGVIRGGYVGVDVFFVISGFLITLHLFRELQKTGRISFSGFYGRRVIRLLPASTLVVVATVAAAWQWMSPSAAKAVTYDALTAVVYGINVRLSVQGTDYLAAARPPSPLQHFWSLAVEEQFYFVWPLLLVVASAAWLRTRRGRPSRASAATVLSLLAAGSFALCVWQTRVAEPWAYFGIQARAWELAAGALVALAADRLARLHPAVAGLLGFAGLAAVLASTVVFTDATPFPGAAAALPVLGAALVIAGGCAERGRGAGAVLGIAPLRGIGKLSYSWYLWHWPVLTMAPYVVGHPVASWVKTVLAVGSLLPAWLSMVLVENRVRFNPVFKRRPRKGLALGAMLSALTVGAAVIFMGLPAHVQGSGTAKNTADAVSAAQKLADAQRALLALVQSSAPLTSMPVNLVPDVGAASRNLPADTGCLASLDDTSTVAAMKLGCDRYGDRAATATMVLFGDSHTEQWFGAVDAVAKQRHLRLVVLTKSGCTPADVLTIKINTRRVYSECATWREKAFTLMASLKPVLVLMSTRTYETPPVDKNGKPVPGAPDTTWTKALLDSAQRVRQLGARTVIMQDTPDPAGVDVPDCVATHPKAVQQCALQVTKAVYAGRRTAIAAAANAAGIVVVDPTDWFCTATVCPAIVGNALVYRDGSHVTDAYVKLLTPLLGGAVPQ
jgi:peptidoglycan/LPS O-acetylase OafA/YrhL